MAIYACKGTLPYCRKSTAAFLIHRSDRLAALQQARCSLAAQSSLYLMPLSVPSIHHLKLPCCKPLFSSCQWLLGSLAWLCVQVSDSKRYWDVLKLSPRFSTRSYRSLPVLSQEKVQDELQPISKTPYVSLSMPGRHYNPLPSRQLARGKKSSFFLDKKQGTGKE